MLVLTGLAFYHPSWSLKLAIVIYFVLMTNPISSHALARAAHATGVPMTRTSVVDALSEAKRQDGSAT
jgi:multicomponent Na+:H+ antiporter subunit G